MIYDDLGVEKQKIPKEIINKTKESPFANTICEYYGLYKVWSA